jgi:hypothetical protein
LCKIEHVILNYKEEKWDKSWPAKYWFGYW